MIKLLIYQHDKISKFTVTTYLIHTFSVPAGRKRVIL